MKVVVCVLLLCVSITLAADPFSTSQLKNVDIDGILHNQRLVTSYVRCLLDDGKCITREARELKQILPDGLKTGCEKCSPQTKMVMVKVIRHMQKERPKDFRAITAKFDPQGEYKKHYQNLGL